MNKDNFRQAAPSSVSAKMNLGKDSSSPEIVAPRKDFSTGSMGWFANQKVDVVINGEVVRCQVNVTITAVGSKEWK